MVFVFVSTRNKGVSPLAELVPYGYSFLLLLCNIDGNIQVNSLY